MSEKIFVVFDKQDATIEKKENVNGYTGLTKLIIAGKGDNSVHATDGYHTFEELYDHRITLFIALCQQLEIIAPEYGNYDVWRSKVNGDGSIWDGWFILGINKKHGKQITYHLPLDRWEETNFAETLDKAPDWDGHSPKDVLERLKSL